MTLKTEHHKKPSSKNPYSVAATARRSIWRTTMKRKRKTKRTRDGALHHNTRKYLEKRLAILRKTFNPIPFVPKNALNISTHEPLLKRAGLWNFVRTEFDSELRTDLVAEMVVGYKPDAKPHPRSIVNGFLLKIDKNEMGRALGLVMGEESFGLAGISDEDVLFLEKVIFNWMALDGDNGGVVVLDEVMKVLWKERRPEKVDWAGLMWAMVERELLKGVELEECWYASHLQFFLRKVKPSLFADEVEKEGHGRRGMIGNLVRCGVLKLDSEEVSGLAVEEGGEYGAGGQGSGVIDDCGGGLGDVGRSVGPSGNGDILRGEGGENEKVVKSLVCYQRRQDKSGRVVDCCEGLKLESVEEVSSFRFGQGGGGEEGNMDVLILSESGDDFMEGGFQEEGEKCAGLRLVYDETRKEIKGKCCLNGEEYRIGEVCEESTSLIVEEGKEEALEQDDSAMETENEESGVLNDVADMKFSIGDDDSGKLLENEDASLVCEQGNTDELKSVEEDDDVIGVETGGSDDSYAMQGIERVGVCSVQVEEQLKVEQDELAKGGFGEVSAMGIESEYSGSLDEVACVKINKGDDARKLLENEGMDLVSEQGKDDQLKLDEEGEEMIGMETGGSSDSYVVKQENEQLGFYSVQTEQELKVEEENLKLDDSLMGDVSDMQVENEKSELLDDVAEDDGGKQLENEDVDLIDEQGKVDQLKLDEDKDEVVVIGPVRADGSGNLNAMKQENERVWFCSVLNEQHPTVKQIGQGVDVVQKELDYEQAKTIEGRIGAKVWEIGLNLGMKENTEEMVLHDIVKEVEDGRISSPEIRFDDDSESDEVVEVSDDDYSDSDGNPSGSPRYSSKINECSAIESLVSETKSKMEMVSAGFFGNSSKRMNAHESDAFVEPFVLEHNLDAYRSDASVFQNSLKIEIDLLNDCHKRQRRANQSGKKPTANIDMGGVSLSPLKRKLEHTSDDHGRRTGGNNQSNGSLMDFDSCKEQIAMWLGRAKMVYAAREETWISAQIKEQKLVKELGHLDNIIRFHETAKHEELRQRDLKINGLENSLFFVANQIDDYKKALQAINKSFAAYRENCEVPAKPLYRGVKGSGASH